MDRDLLKIITILQKLSEMLTEDQALAGHLLEAEKSLRKAKAHIEAQEDRMRTFNLTQPGAQLPMTQRVIPPRQITPTDARVFFQYQNEDKVAEALSDYFGVDIEVLSLVKIDSAGDVFFRRDDIGSRLLLLDDEGLTELALTMGWRDWVQPNYPPLPPMR